jgi:HEAT repeat protein
VPGLIEAIKNAASTAASFSGVTMKGATAANRIRRRAAMVLGEIGDRRALPTLKDLLKHGAPFEHGDPYVEAAIAALEKRR